MNYEESIKWILVEIGRGVWDGSQQVRMSKEESDLVESAKIEGYIIYSGDGRAVFKGGAIYTGKFFLTEKGEKALYKNNK